MYTLEFPCRPPALTVWREQPTALAQAVTVSIPFIWGFDYNFTNYTFRKALDCLNNILPER